MIGANLLGTGVLISKTTHTRKQRDVVQRHPGGVKVSGSMPHSGIFISDLISRREWLGRIEM